MQATSTKNSTSTLLLLLGSCLIVIAVIVLISYSWDSFLPYERSIVATLPLLFLYGLGFYSDKKKGPSSLSHYTILAGSLIFPLVTGIILYQTGLFGTPDHPIDSLLVFNSAFFSLIWYLILEFSAGQTTHSPFTILAALVSVVAFADILAAPAYIYSLFFVGLSYFFLSTGWYLRINQHHYQAPFYTYSGLVAGWLGLMSFPPAFNHSWFNLTTTAYYLVISLIFFLVATLYSQAWQRDQHDEYLQVRQVAEQFAAICLTVPAVLATFNGISTTAILFLILLGVISVGISIFVRVSTFRWLGLISLVLGILELLLFAANKVSGFWPILLLLVGFLLVGCAYVIHYLPYKNLFSSQTLVKGNFFHLGEQPVLLKPEVHSPVVNSPETFRLEDHLIWLILAVIILIIILASIFS